MTTTDTFDAPFPPINPLWIGTTNLGPRRFTDDAWRTRVTVRHLQTLLARERENDVPDEGDYAARRVAVHYRIVNAPWV